MSSKDFNEVLDLIRKEDPRYDKGAYYFVRQALDFAMKDKRWSESTSRGNHISGQQLLDAIREFALDQYGPMTMTLMQQWGITQTRDFGEIVFNLVDYGILGKTEEDNIEDFTDGYDFREAFEIPFLPESAKSE